jgi:hypothetical protein
MFLWDKTEAKSGSAETATCILKYCMLHFQPLQLQDKRHLIIRSDRCVGQNNNNWTNIALNICF